MVDFRKWFLAFAVVAILMGTAVTASAQPFGCSVNQGVPPTVRAEGMTELVGDIILTCTGGTPTPAGQVVPQANISVSLQTNITSRLLSSPWNEALLIIDDPASPSAPAVPQAVCGAPGTPDNVSGSGPGVCVVLGTNGSNNGKDTYNPNVASAATPANSGRPNVYQGRTSPGSNSQVLWLGIPFDPPGSTGVRTIRITNIRANASQLGVSATLIPSQIAAFVSITASTSIPLTNSNITVAYIQPGLITSVRNQPVTLQQCVNANGDIAGDNTKALNSGGQNGAQFVIRYDEGIPSSYKPRNTNTSLTTSPTPIAQSVPGAVYNTETGFYNPNFPSLSGRGNLAVAGLADHGTRLRALFANVGAGTQIFVPVLLNVIRISDGAITGAARLVTTDANGAGAYSATAATNGSLAPITVTSGGALAIYEILASDPFNFERVDIPVAVAFVSNTTSNLPGLGQATVRQSFAPLSTVTTASSSAPIPRFVESGTDRNGFNIIQCVCNILFPFVTNQLGFDTGVAISNTSQDPFGTATQSGTVTLNYYGSTTGGGTAPAAQVSTAIPAGGQLVFTLSSGGTNSIAATPGFQGYIIATARFQYCHAFTFISDLGSNKLAEGYLGIILDQPSLYRTGQVGENLAH
jgi:hypothetical protein